MSGFVKKSRRPGGLRKREASPTEVEEDTNIAEIVQMAKKQIVSHLTQSTSKRRKTIQVDGMSSEEDDQDSVLVRHRADTKRERRRSTSPPAEMSTETINLRKKTTSAPTTTADDGLYKGAKNVAHQLSQSFGPIKGGPSNVRTITLMDYQPDVCKDYKETGFCGFGDSCKFLHDRGDYLAGWQLDNAYLSNSVDANKFMAKQRNKEGDYVQDSDSEKEDLPFACLICRNPFGKNPIVTLCGHYFDSECAIKRFKKSAKCFACGKDTNGVFNQAKKLFNKQKEADRIKKRAKEADGEPDSEEENDVDIEGLDNQQASDVASDSGNDIQNVQSEQEHEPSDNDDVAKPAKRRPVIIYE